MMRVGLKNRFLSSGSSSLLRQTSTNPPLRALAIFSTFRASRSLANPSTLDEDVRLFGPHLGAPKQSTHEPRNNHNGSNRTVPDRNGSLEVEPHVRPDRRNRKSSSGHRKARKSPSAREHVDAGRPPLSPKNPERPSSRQRWTKSRRQDPRAAQLRHLRHISDEASFPAAENDLREWVSKYDHYIAAGTQDEPLPCLEAGRWLGELDTATAMREAWTSLDLDVRKKTWIDVMVATLIFSPSKAVAVLESTLDPVPPEYAVHDVLLFIARRQNFTFFENARQRTSSAIKIVELVEKILVLYPKNNLFFSEQPFALLARHLPCDYVDEIYDMLRRAGLKPSFHTSLHFARSLGSETKYKRKALEILNPLLQGGSAHPAMHSVITTLLTYRPAEGDGTHSEPQLTPETALRSLVERNYVPNVINLTAGLDALCQYGEYKEAARLALLFAEENIKLDGRTAAKLFKGAKLSLQAENVQKAFEIAEITSMPYVDVLNEGLHAMYYFATMESHHNEHEAPWTLPVFLPMLHLYSQRFALEPLQRWLPVSLPLLLRGGGPAMDTSDMSRWPSLNSVTSVVGDFFGKGANGKEYPNSTTIATMLRAYIKSLRDPHDILRFYHNIKSQLEEGRHGTPIAKLMEENGSLLHDTLIRAMMERPWFTRAGLSIFGDMLQAHVKRLEGKSEKRDPAIDLNLPLHPSPSRFTFAIVITGLMTRGSVTLAEQMVNIMHEHGIEVDLPIWNTIIKGHARTQDIKNTVAALRKMEAAGFSMSNRTFRAFGKLQNQKAAFKIMERIIEENMQSMLDEQFSEHASTTAGKTDIQARLHKLEELVKVLSESPSQGLSTSSTIDTDTRSLQSAQRTRLWNTSDEENANYHGATAWTAIVDSIHDIRNALDAEEGQEIDHRPVNVGPDVVLTATESITIEDIVSYLPPRPDMDRLVQTYFNSKFVASTYIHAHHFRRRYEAFLTDPASGSYLWVSILFSILCIGSLVLKLKNPDDLHPTTVAEPAFYMAKASQCLVAGEYLKARGFSVEALLIHAQCRNVMRKDSDPTIWSLYGLAIRLAQRRGYHRSTMKISTRTTPFEAEMRRRAWNTIQSADLVYSFQLGMPSMIQEDLCDVEPPANLNDEDFDEDTPLPAPRPPCDPSPILAYSVKAHMCKILRRIMHHALAVITPPHAETFALNAQLEDCYAAIPACLRNRPIRSTSFTDPNYTIMHRLMLRILYLKSLCVLHRPYLTLGKGNPVYKSSREICRNAGRSMLDLHIEVNREIQVGGRLHEDRYMVTSLAMHDFLVAAMVVCLDIHESADISAQERETSIKALEEVHEIWMSNSSESSDARHASKVLGAVLRKATTSGPRNISPQSTPQSNDYEMLHNDDQDKGRPEVVCWYGDAITTNCVGVNLDSTHVPLDWISIDNFLRDGSAETSSWPLAFEGM
ncbi:putative transcriptional regulatory protein [Paramyrothecium foliicola]|nr:putative transcriptional regulatory protein [Paramyrothecium foliicola]